MYSKQELMNIWPVFSISPQGQLQMMDYQRLYPGFPHDLVVTLEYSLNSKQWGKLDIDKESIKSVTHP